MFTQDKNISLPSPSYRIKNRAKKIRYHYDPPACEPHTCTQCHSVLQPRVVTLDADLVATLEWFGSLGPHRGDVPVTKVASKGTKIIVPDWIIGQRNYGKLRYWGFLTEGKTPGTYCLTREGVAFLGGAWPAPEWVVVQNDKVIGSSAYLIKLGDIPR